MPKKPARFELMVVRSRYCTPAAVNVDSEMRMKRLEGADPAGE